MTIDHISRANLPFWGQLPMGVTNFGGDTQVFTIPDYSTAQIGCYLNPAGLNAINGYGPQPYNNWGYPGVINNYGPIFNFPPQQYPGGYYPTVPGQNGGCTCPHHTNPFDELNRNTAQTMAQKFTKQNIATTMNSIRSLEQKLNSMLSDSKYTDEQKEEINKNLDIINQAEADLVDLATLTEDKNVSAGDIQEQLNTIEQSVRTVLSSVGELNKPADPDALSKEEDKDSDGIRDVATYSDEGVQLAEQFYNAVNDTTLGIPCTDDEAFESVCSQLNKNNILDVMLAYSESHPGESFMEAFMWDADHGQKRDYGKHIRNVLFEKARELGVTKECANDFKEIDEELDDYCISNDISKNFDNIIGILAKASKQPYNASSTNKTGEEQKASEWSAKEVTKTGGCAAAGAAIGACVGGPAGALVGGLIGGVVGWFS